MGTFIDGEGTVWVRHLDGIEFSTLLKNSCIQVRGESCFRRWPDGGVTEFDGTWCEQIKAAWAALMTPKEVPRPVSAFERTGPAAVAWEDDEGDLWFLEPGPTIRCHVTYARVEGDHVLYRTGEGGPWLTAKDTPCFAQCVREAWRILVGHPLPSEAPKEVPFEERMWGHPRLSYSWTWQRGPKPGTVCRVGAGLNPTLEWVAADHSYGPDGRMPGLDEAIAYYWPKADLAPAHHWSFVCTPERVDIARVYREMVAQGVDRNDVKIAIRPHGKKNLRVAVSSRGAGMARGLRGGASRCSEAR